MELADGREAIKLVVIIELVPRSHMRAGNLWQDKKVIFGGEGYAFFIALLTAATKKINEPVSTIVAPEAISKRYER